MGLLGRIATCAAVVASCAAEADHKRDNAVMQAVSEQHPTVQWSWVILELLDLVGLRQSTTFVADWSQALTREVASGADFFQEVTERLSKESFVNLVRLNQPAWFDVDHFDFGFLRLPDIVVQGLERSGTLAHIGLRNRLRDYWEAANRGDRPWARDPVQFGATLGVVLSCDEVRAGIRDALGHDLRPAGGPRPLVNIQALVGDAATRDVFMELRDHLSDNFDVAAAVRDVLRLAALPAVQDNLLLPLSPSGIHVRDLLADAKVHALLGALFESTGRPALNNDLHEFLTQRPQLRALVRRLVQWVDLDAVVADAAFMNDVNDFIARRLPAVVQRILDHNPELVPLARESQVIRVLRWLRGHERTALQELHDALPNGVNLRGFVMSRSWGGEDNDEESNNKMSVGVIVAITVSAVFLIVVVVVVVVVVVGKNKKKKAHNKNKAAATQQEAGVFVYHHHDGGVLQGASPQV